MAFRSAVVLLLAAGCSANMYDVFEPYKLPPPGCTGGCADWSDVAPSAGALFANGAVPADASNKCAMPAMATSTHHPANGTVPVESSWAGAWCYCKNNATSTPIAAYCVSDIGVPEQINLQIGGATVVVAGFVTFESAMPTDPPVAMLTQKGGESKQLAGVSHWYMEKAGPNCGYPHTDPCTKHGRNYTMSFVRYDGLKPATSYSYKVKSGAPGAKWSDTFEFRSPGPDGGTSKVAVYGDMGVYAWNNMANLKEDCASGVVDAIVHMGDHCYFWDDTDNKRGDGYMNAFQPTLATCPWMPIVRALALTNS
jgi:hypothetical protein